VDVTGPKKVNDTLGHAAGDELLVEVASQLKSQLRPYDLTVRVGGDEFLCAVSGMPEDDVRSRFGAIDRALTARPDCRGIRTGFATLRDGESAGRFDLSRGRSADQASEVNDSPGSSGASCPVSQRSTLAPTSASGPSCRRPPSPAKRASSMACSRVWSVC
jgi:GGDEF domain-containing protein